jgi:hypothetical protein
VPHVDGAPRVADNQPRLDTEENSIRRLQIDVSGQQHDTDPRPLLAHQFTGARTEFYLRHIRQHSSYGNGSRQPLR